MKILVQAASVLLFAVSAHALTNSIAAEDAAFQSNVYISSAAHDDTGAEVNGYCNATVLSPQVLVTAAHCIVESLAMSKNQIHIEVGAYKYMPRKSDNKVVRVGYVTSYKKDFEAHFIISKSLQRRIGMSFKASQVPPNEDVALVVLHDKLEVEPTFNFAGVVPQKLWADLKGRMSAAQFFAVSVNYWTTVTTNDTKRSAILDKFSYNGGGWLESRSTARVEEGDSGSPIYLRYQGHTYIAAVVKGQASTIFSNWDVMPTLSTKACDVAHENNLATEVLGLVCR